MPTSFPAHLFAIRGRQKKFKNSSGDDVFSCMIQVCWANTFSNLSEAAIRFNKSWRPTTLFKRYSFQQKFFPVKLCDIFKNAYFEDYLRTASFTLNLIFKTSTAYSVYFLLSGVCFSLYLLIHVINLLFSDVICIYFSVSFYSIAFIANPFILLATMAM